MIPERYLSEKAKLKRKQYKQGAENGSQFHQSMAVGKPRKPKVNSSLGRRKP
jgi:hypothetical protein